MASTAQDNLPYPAADDSPGQGYQNIADLADAVQAALTARDSRQPWATAAGHVTITPTVDTPTSAHVDFPSGRFTVPPVVTAVGYSTVPGQTLVEVAVSAPTSAGMDIIIYRHTDTDTGVDWTATQMTPASAEG